MVGLNFYEKRISILEKIEHLESEECYTLYNKYAELLFHIEQLFNNTIYIKVQNVEKSFRRCCKIHKKSIFGKNVQLNIIN